MKTILFIITLLACMNSNAYSQENYKSLEECGNDTLTYVKYNFHDNKQRYIGKSMQFIMDEWESFITYSYIATETGPWAPEEIRRKVDGLYLSYLLPHEETYYEKTNKEYYDVLILFNAPPYVHDYIEFERVSMDENRNFLLWSEKQYNFFKDYTIKDIIVRNSQGNRI